MTRNQQQEKYCKKHKHVETQQHATNNQWTTEEIKEEIKKYLEASNNKDTIIEKPLGCIKCSSRREVYSNTGIPQETKKRLK